MGSRRITRGNLTILDEWVAGESKIRYVSPCSGTTALLRYDLRLPSVDLCRTVQAETGVMLLPGSARDVEGWLRVGYACDTGTLREGLALFGDWLALR